MNNKCAVCQAEAGYVVALGKVFDIPIKEIFLCKDCGQRFLNEYEVAELNDG